MWSKEGTAVEQSYHRQKGLTTLNERQILVISLSSVRNVITPDYSNWKATWLDLSMKNVAQVIQY